MIFTQPIRLLVQAIRRTCLRRQCVSLPSSCHLGKGIIIRCGIKEGIPGKIQFDDDCRIEDGVILDAYGGTIGIGKNVFIGPYVVIYGHGGVEIGEKSLISMHCRILSSNHAIPPVGIPINSQPDVLLPTRIGRDVWLGAGVTVLGGVTIGDNCIIGAGAVVTRDIPPGSIAYGVPATVHSQRSSR